MAGADAALATAPRYRPTVDDGKSRVTDFVVSPAASFRLGPGVQLKGRVITDQSTSVTHELNSTGAQALQFMIDGHTFGEACSALARAGGVSESVVEDDLRTMLVHLDSYDLLAIRNPRAGARVRQAWFTLGYGLSNPSWSYLALLAWITRPPRTGVGRRFEPNIWGICRGALLSQRRILTTAATLAIVFMGLVLVLRLINDLTIGDEIAFGLKLVLAAAGFFLLVVAHEYGHLAALRLLREKASYVVARPLTVSLVHGELTGGKEIFVGLAGPVLALAVGIGAAALLHVAGREPFGILTVSVATFMVAMAALHLLSLGPWSSDGKPLWRKLARTRKSEAP
jgi:hypothetical protein